MTAIVQSTTPVMPWVKEILALAAKEYFEKGNIESAEETLGRAYEIDSSGEVAVLLGRVKQAKGDQALRKGDLQEAQAFYEEALGKAPENQDYPKYRREVSKLVKRERLKNQRAVWAYLGLTVIGVIFGLWIGKSNLPTQGRGTGEVEKFRSENSRLVAEKGALSREISSLKSQLGERDQEIENLRNKIQDPDGSKRGIEGLRQQLVREQQRRIDAEQGLTRAHGKITSLENRIGELEKAADRPAERGTEKPRLGWYRVLHETPLLRNPYENAEVILYLSPERLVRIVDVVDGRWLKVLSRLGNPPGYIRKEDVVLTRPETGSR